MYNSDMDLQEKAKAFAALSDPMRLRILGRLGRCGESCGKHLATDLGASVALVSHHVKVLEAAGLVSRRKDGQYHRFSLRREALGELFDVDQFDENGYC